MVPGREPAALAFALYWRKDGQRRSGRTPSTSPAEPRGAQKRPAPPRDPRPVEILAEGVAERLGSAAAMPSGAMRTRPIAGAGGSLPDNVDPIDSKLKDPEERARITRVFDRGLDQPAG